MLFDHNMYITGDTSSGLDLQFYYAGYENCKPGHFFGPAIRDHYLVHYILDGKGFFQVGSKVYNLAKGDGFLICPGIKTFYKADDTNPWVYMWVAFNGISAERYMARSGISWDKPVFNYSHDESLLFCIQEIITSDSIGKCRDILQKSLLFKFVSILVDNCTQHEKANINSRELYLKKAIEYVNINYSRTLTVQGLSKYLGINRKYLFLIFKDALGVSPQQFLVNFRIDKACGFFHNPLLNISDIARSVGYVDPLLFSRIFKKCKGMSPKEYRKKTSSE